MIQNFLTFIRSNTFSYSNNTIIKYFSVSCLSYFLQGISALFIFTLGLNTFFYIIFLSGHGGKKTSEMKYVDCFLSGSRWFRYWSSFLYVTFSHCPFRELLLSLMMLIRVLSNWYYTSQTFTLPQRCLDTFFLLLNLANFISFHPCEKIIGYIFSNSLRRTP